MRERIRSRRRVLRVGAGSLSLAIAGCLGSGSSGERTVTMDDRFAFDPETVTVQTGETVVWQNESDVGHTVTAYEDQIPSEGAYFASGGFESEREARNDVSGGLLDSGESYEHTFEVAGTYDYYCIPHESGGMVGTVEVR